MPSNIADGNRTRTDVVACISLHCTTTIIHDYNYTRIVQYTIRGLEPLSVAAREAESYGSGLLARNLDRLKRSARKHRPPPPLSHPFFSFCIYREIAVRGPE